jgi:hypothetical protein
VVLLRSRHHTIMVDAEREWAWVRRAPIVERFTVGADDEGVLRTDHDPSRPRHTRGTARSVASSGRSVIMTMSRILSSNRADPSIRRVFPL